MNAKKKEAIQRYRELTKGLIGKELQKAINDFRRGKYTQDLYPHTTVRHEYDKDDSND